ncbi:MAG: MFS transporter [Candidatus Obscuribacterales bacterium]|nr:MFS transporter [Candidatus Obscuribacterales bacterium]
MNQPDKPSLVQRVAREMQQTFRSLNNRDFRVYSWGQVISLSGTWMQSVALSWLVYKLTGSAAALGMVTFAGSLPLLLLTYPGGIIADRFDRKKVLVISQVLAMIEATALTVLTYTGLINVTWLVILAIIRGSITAIELPARQSFVPDMVEKGELTNAIGINSAIWNTSRTIGPALAGLFIGIFGETVCFALNALSYVAALISLGMITVKPREHNAKTDEQDSTGAGNRSVWSILMDPKVRTVLFLSAATSLFGFQYGVLLPVVVDQVLGGTASTLGFISAAAGIGALVGSLALANRGNSRVLRPGIGIACLSLSVAIALIAFSKLLIISVVAVALAGASVSVQLSGGNSLVQSSVSERYRGRVMGLYSTFMLGFAPLAAMLAGWLAEYMGVSYTLYLSSFCVFVAASLYLFFSRKLKEKDDGTK